MNSKILLTIFCIVVMCMAPAAFAGGGDTGAGAPQVVLATADESGDLNRVADGFYPSPNPYIKGVSGDLVLSYSAKEFDNVIFQVWHLDDNNVQGDLFMPEGPFVYPAEKLAEVNDGRGSIQALIRQGNTIIDSVKLEVEFTSDVPVTPQSVTNELADYIRSQASNPASNSALDINKDGVINVDDASLVQKFGVCEVDLTIEDACSMIVCEYGCVNGNCLPMPPPPIPTPEPEPENTDIYVEYFNDVSGSKLSSLLESSIFPNNPTAVEVIPTWEITPDRFNNYGTRIRGLLMPPVTGEYTFWVTGDDNSEVYLSTDATPANAEKIASVTGWTKDREFEKYPSQKSTVIVLEAGKYYYIESLHKEGGGLDNLAVFWQAPGSESRDVIEAKYVKKYEGEDTVTPDFHFKVNGLEANQVVSGERQVTVTSDYEGFVVDQVIFTIPGLYEKEENYAPFSMAGDRGDSAINAWDSTQVADGKHTLYVEVLYESGKKESTQIEFTVKNDAEPYVCAQNGFQCSADQVCPGEDWSNQAERCCTVSCVDEPVLPPLPPPPPPPGPSPDPTPEPQPDPVPAPNPDLPPETVFASTPQQITIGSAPDIELLIGQDYDGRVASVIFQVWSSSSQGIEGDQFDSQAPYVYNAQALNTVPAGDGSVQALVRDASGTILYRAEFSTEFVGSNTGGDTGGTPTLPPLPPLPPPPTFG